MEIVNQILFYLVTYVSLFVSIFWLTSFFISDRKRPIVGMLPPLSIIVPVHNGSKYLKKCVYSLLNQNYPGLRIIIADNASTDDTKKVAKQLEKKHKNIEYLYEKRKGKAVAINSTLKKISTKLFGFLDVDTHLSKNALRNMVGYLDGNTASVIATIKPSNTGNTIEKIQKIEYMISSFTRKILTFLDSLYYTPGFALYKTAVVKKIGGFDEDTITEDLEIGLRLKTNGYNIEHSMDDSAYTIVPKTFRELFTQRMRWYRGFISNSRKYSHLFFNRRFGDLGLLILPLQYILMALMIPLFIFSVYEFGFSLFKNTIDVYNIGLDFGYFAGAINFNFITPSTFFFVILLASFFYMLRLTRLNINEKVGKMECIIYVIFYPFINIILWLSAFVHEILGTKRKWV
ncbi:glycosyltransferase [Candidatus Aenigmatarchaeota archaeon]